MKLERWVVTVRTMNMENPQKMMLVVAMKKTPSSKGLNTSSIARMKLKNYNEIRNGYTSWLLSAIILQRRQYMILTSLK
jgi:hypothetical protein